MKKVNYSLTLTTIDNTNKSLARVALENVFRVLFEDQDNQGDKSLLNLYAILFKKALQFSN